MNKLIFSALVLIGFGAKAQQISPSSVPGAVQSTYSNLYPNDKADNWKKNGANYDAEFTKDNKKMGTTLNSRGELMETREEVDMATLPADARDYISQNLGDEKGTKVYKVISAQGGDESYKVCGKTQALYFDNSGKLIKTENTARNKVKGNGMNGTKDYMNTSPDKNGKGFQDDNGNKTKSKTHLNGKNDTKEEMKPEKQDKTKTDVNEEEEKDNNQ